MKKINSISYGGEVLLAGSILAFAIPLLIKVIPFHIAFLKIVAFISAAIGGSILVIFCAMLLIESYQDKKMNTYYEQHKNVKLKIDEGKYECSTCGNREVTAASKVCPICGTQFKE